MKKFYKTKIIKILPGSIVKSLDIEPGDSLISIDNQVLKDLLDYQFAISDTSELKILIEKKDKSQKEYTIYKNPSEDLGLVFESGVFDKTKVCNNRCIFCFVDQQPPDLRDTLYVKDDDYRLSYLHGTYITLTNLTNSDKNRIETLRLGPLFISVHTTNPELRISMLNNPLAGDIIEKLNWLNDLFIPIHTQIVVCPGFNDGKELEKTLNDLASLDNVLSVAIVPVGITKYRQDTILKPFTKDIAKETLRIISKVNKKKDEPFAQPSDEIYLLADETIPDSSFYNDFPQIEDGVGSTRYTLEQFESVELPKKLNKNRHIGIITSSLGASVLKPIFSKLTNIKNLDVDIIEIKNKFWGKQITVCGLVVGNDIIETLKTLKVIPPEIFLPSVMLRKFSTDFLDGVKIEDIEKKVNTKVHIINDCYNFEELINIINS